MWLAIWQRQARFHHVYCKGGGSIFNEKSVEMVSKLCLARICMVEIGMPMLRIQRPQNCSTSIDSLINNTFTLRNWFLMPDIVVFCILYSFYLFFFSSCRSVLNIYPVYVLKLDHECFMADSFSFIGTFNSICFSLIVNWY